MGLTAIPVGLLLLLSSAACLHCPPFPSGNCEYEDFSPYISYNDINLFNNSYVNVSNGATLTCHANSTCCSSSYTRIWTNPYNEQVPSNKSMDIYQTLPTEQSVKLHHKGNKDFGVYCCAITCCDKKTICVGLYEGKI